MKNRLTIALAAAFVAAATSASAQYHNGDLLVGFDGGANDFILDLGAVSSLTLGETWNVGVNAGARFGVIGAQSTGQHIYATSFDNVNENAFDPTGLYFNGASHMPTIAQGILSGGSRTPSASDTTGWSVQTDQPPGTPGNTFQNDYFNPNVPAGSSAYLYDNLNTGTVTPMSRFTYDSASGTL